jgi:uncharacterized protein (DUF1697 family)
MARHLALLRGINVGGRNIITMSDLRAVFEDAGFDEVRTHLQSGNVVFDGPARVSEDGVEELLEQRFGLRLVVVLRTRRQLGATVDRAPPGFGDRPERYHYDAIFLKAPLTSGQAMRVVALRDGVDDAWPGTGVIYFRRLSSERTRSRLNSVVGTDEYRSMTIRNWRTTTALSALIEDR